MRSIAYSAIERGVAATAGVDPTSILSHEKVLLAEYITDAVKYCWDYYPWAEFTKTEVRYFRDEFDPSSTYPVGSEVYYDGKYYRNYQEATGGTPLDLVFWYEIGDIDDAPEWTENGCYYIGAKVRYKNKLYLCVSEPTDPIAAYGNQPCCFEVNGITPESSNFIEISIKFDRYISYEQVGRDIIGTCLSITLEDPRYNDTTPLNWREGREGIYIDPYDKTFNEVWVRYRIESPVFNADSADEEVPNFLAQAIKAYAYKHWLVGDGQHEKAQLQDMYGLDLLVRELDKLDSQQDRAAPFTITKEPYRRLNAKQSHKAPITAEQIAAVKKGLAEIAMSVDTDFKGKNAVVKAIIDGDPILDLIVTALNIVRKGYPQIFLRLKPDVRAKNAAQYREVQVFTKVYTGKAYRSINIGQVKALKLNVVWSPPINGRVNIYSSQVARNCVKQSTIKVMPTRVSCDSVIGYNPVKFGNAYLAAVITAQNVQAKNIVGQGVSVAPVRIDGVFNGRNVVQRGYSTAAIAITDITQGDNIVVKGVATAAVSVVTQVLGKNAIVKGESTVVLTTSLIATSHRERLREASTVITYKITNGRDSVVQLWNSRTTPQTDSRLNLSSIPSAGSGSVSHILFETMGRRTQPETGQSYLPTMATRLASVTLQEFFSTNQQFKLVHTSEFENESFFSGKSVKWYDLPNTSLSQNDGFHTTRNIYEDMLLVGQTPINIHVPEHTNGESEENIQGYLIAYFQKPRINQSSHSGTRQMYFGSLSELLPQNTTSNNGYGEFDQIAASSPKANHPRGLFSDNFQYWSGNENDAFAWQKNNGYMIKFRILLENARPTTPYGFGYGANDLILDNYDYLQSIYLNSSVSSGTLGSNTYQKTPVTVTGAYCLDPNYSLDFDNPTQPKDTGLIQNVIFAAQKESADLSGQYWKYNQPPAPYREHAIVHDNTSQDPWDTRTALYTADPSWNQASMPFTCNVIPDGLPTTFPETFGESAHLDWANNDWVTIGQCTNKNVVIAEKE
jgi:hypothetical protein